MKWTIADMSIIHVLENSIWRSSNSDFWHTMQKCFLIQSHDDVIIWKHFPRYWPFVRGIHRSPVNSPHKGQWRGALVFSLICAWINGWINNREADDSRHHRSHYDVSVKCFIPCNSSFSLSCQLVLNLVSLRYPFIYLFRIYLLTKYASIWWA